MTPARRIMGGGLTMLPDSRYPRSDIWEESRALIEAALARTGRDGNLLSAWRCELDHYKWHGKKKFLPASIAHSKYFAGWLLGQPGRDGDAAVYDQLALDLARLKAKERARQPASAGGESAVETEIPNNKQRVDRYLSEASKVAERRITRTMFWRSRGYKDATAFQAFQRNDSDPKRNTPTARSNFEAALKVPIPEFLEFFEEKTDRLAFSPPPRIAPRTAGGSMICSWTHKYKPPQHLKAWIMPRRI